MKQPEINEEVELTLKFRVEEATHYCRGCWGENSSRHKCLLLRETFGSCFGVQRPDKKNVIFKLIKEEK